MTRLNSPPRKILYPLVAIAVAILQACGDTTAPVSSIVISPATVSLNPGATAQMAAVTLGGSDTLRGRTITWSTSSSTVATVSGNGLVTAIGLGTATITATSEGRSATAEVSVVPVPVSSVQITPIFSPLSVGGTAQLNVSTLDAKGNSLGGRTVTYASSSDAIARVSATGLVTAVAPGTATITATSEGRTAQATIVVSPVPVATVAVTPNPITLTVGGSTQVSAIARDVASNPLTGRIVIWSSSNEDVAVVSSTGRVIGTGVGSAIISATVEGRVGQASVTVATAVASIDISPTSPVVALGGTLQLVATARDASGSVLSRPISWSSNNNAVVTVSASGVLTGVSVGTATITASSEGRSVQITATVATPVASIEVTPTAVSLAAGQTQQITATLRDAQGAVISDRPLNWSSSNTAIATVSSTGLIRGTGAGTATVTATIDGRTASVAVTVGPAALDRVVVDPANLEMLVGESFQLSARVRDTQGSVVSGQTFTWVSNNNGVATVSSTGVVTGVAAGTATITATASPSGLAGTSTITVVALPDGSFEVQGLRLR